MVENQTFMKNIFNHIFAPYFRDKEMSKVESNYIFLVVILIDLVLKKD